MEDDNNPTRKAANNFYGQDLKPEHPPLNYTVGEVYMIRK